MFNTQPYMRRFPLPSIFLATFLLSASCLADDAPTAQDIKRAARAYDQGRERFREEQYVEAAEKFESADSYAPSAAALRLAIFARKEAGQLDRALTHAALALELYPDNPELIGEAQTVIDEDGANFGKIDVSCDEPCELLLNNRIVHGRASSGRTIFVQPGTAEIRASWSEGRTQSETVAVDAGGYEQVSFYSPEIPTEVEPSTLGTDEPMNEIDVSADEAKKGGWPPGIFYTGLGLTVVGATTTAILGVRANNNPGPNAVRDNCVKDDVDCPEYLEGRRNQSAANAALGVTAALGVFTIVSAIMTDWGKKKEKDSFSLKSGDLSMSPTFEVGSGAALGAKGTF